MSFARSAANHQGAHAQEPRPDAPDKRRRFTDPSTHACQKILIGDEEWLDGAHLPIFVAENEIAVLESLMDGVFHQFVIAAVLSKTRECVLPRWRALDLSFRLDLDGPLSPDG